MERRNRSLEALNSLIFINSLDDEERAQRLIVWNKNYLTTDINDFDLEINDLKKLSELFFSNIIFLKKHRKKTKIDLNNIGKLKKYLDH